LNKTISFKYFSASRTVYEEFDAAYRLICKCVRPFWAENEKKQVAITCIPHHGDHHAEKDYAHPFGVIPNL
jgi:hypothetical protein